VSAARGSEEAGCADLDDAQAGRWPGSADFDDLVCGYRRELHVYCYRMLGAFDEAEDHVKEVFLRAWRCRDRFQGQASPPTWLYRVATNARLDTLRRDARRAVPAPAGPGPSVAAMPWVQPYPDMPILMTTGACHQAAITRRIVRRRACGWLPPGRRAVCPHPPERSTRPGE
jgi:DNA-directed RNA polymerase specialized sigma24 family protein